MKLQKVVAIAAMLALSAGVCRASPMGTAFTFNGHLSDGGMPANGIYDLRFITYDSASGPTVVGRPLTNAFTPVVQGLFTVRLDFGEAVFNGDARWLEIGVRPTGSANAFVTLTPRQELTPTPYAIHATAADTLTGTLPAAQITGTLGTGQIAAGSIDSSKLATGSVTSTQLAAVSVTTTALSDGAVTDVKISGVDAGKITNGTLADARLSANVALLNANQAFTGLNRFDNPSNRFTGTFFGDGPGFNAMWKLSGNSDTMPGVNYLGTSDSQPLELKVNGQRAFRLEPRAASPNVVGGFSGNSVNSTVAGVTIAGGGSSGNINRVDSSSDYSMIGGGSGNFIFLGHHATIGGGFSNILMTSYSAIAGGEGNKISWGSLPLGHETIGGGYRNLIFDGYYSFIGGGESNLVGYICEFGTVGGGFHNRVLMTDYATIGGGQNNQIGNAGNPGGYGDSPTIGGGSGNTINMGQAATIAGGLRNSIVGQGMFGSPGATIGGGQNNKIDSNGSFGDVDSPTIGGGSGNSIGFASSATIAGGLRNSIVGSIYASTGATISGGAGNFVTGDCGTVPGGQSNVAYNYGFAAGRQAKANHEGSFVWADAKAADFASTTTNEVSFRCTGGVRFVGGAQTVSWAPGNSSWNFTSDRNAKEGFLALDFNAVLDKVCQLPITQWNYQGYPQQHIGPVAQDFHALFPFNASETTIDSADLTGVSLAAIRGLNLKVERENAALRTENADLKARLERLEQLMNANHRGVK